VSGQPGTQPPADRDADGVRDWKLWALLGLFGLLLASHLATPRLDSDQAVTGLMGVEILRGEFPIFFWGQDHAGIPESYGAAVTFAVLGVSRFALCLVPALAAFGLVVALYRTGAVLFGHAAGLLAISFATVVSPYVVAHYVRARAYYIEHLLLAQLLLLGAALVLARPLTEPARTRVLLAMGLAGGFGFYCGFQIVGVLAPAGLALLLADPRLLLRRGAWLALGAFLLASTPFWAYNLAHHWATFATGVRFQGGESGWEAARILARNLLPVILGVQDYVNTPPYLPWPFFLVPPLVVGGALALLAGRVAWAGARVIRDPAVAGEAMLLLAVGATVGLVWYGRFLAVPRYLVPLAPLLALVLARACQLTWRRTRIGAVVVAAAYLATVGIPLVADLIVLWPEKRASYWAERVQDGALFAFMRARGLVRAYGYEYWLVPRLTFDSGATILVAEPLNDKHPPYTKAVDDSPRPAYIVRTSVGLFENWVGALQSRVERQQVGPYHVFWGMTPPPPAVAISRGGWAVRTGPGTGEPATLLDGQFESGWSTAPGPPGSGWLELDFGRPERVAGLVLLTDQPEHLPQALVVDVADGPTPGPTISRFTTGGFAAIWENGALRTRPSRALVVRFQPVEARRLRLTELAPAGNWAVAEVFALAPAAASPDRLPAVREGQRQEAEGAPAAALLAYRLAMRAAPDDPEGYIQFVRLAGALDLTSGWPAERAARLARVGLVDEARILYGRLAASLDAGLVNAELAERRARLAAAAGDTAEARRLRDEAAAVRAPTRPVGAVFGGGVALLGFDLNPTRVQPGGALEVAYHWRLPATSRALAAYIHFVPQQGARGRFADDYGLPEPIRSLGEQTQAIRLGRQVRVPAGTPPGTYRVVAGVWNPATGHRLHRWWHGVVPGPTRTVDLGTVEILPPS
jgi:dolichyl-phosphate-mannose-protein mannosyltransferase